MGKHFIAVSLLALLLTACNSQKQPAEAAFAQIQASLAPVSAELEKYAPEEFARLVALMDDMKSKLNSKDYEGVVALRAQAMQQLAAVSSAAGKRKNELLQQFAGEWKALQVAVPNLLAQLNSRVNYLQGLGKLPVDVAASTFEQAKQSITELNEEWSMALNAARNRDTETAVTKAQLIKKRGAEVGAMLGLKIAS